MGSSAAFPNRPFRLRAEAWFNSQSGQSASVHGQIWIDKTAYSPTFSGATSSWVFQAQSVTHASWSGGFDFRNGSNFLLWEGNFSTTKNLDGGVWIAAYANFDILGYTETAFALMGTPTTAPPAPTPIGLDEITATSMRYRFSGNGNGGSAIIRWEYQYSTSPTFASGNSAWITSTGTSTATGLTPGTTYYFRSRGVNALGNGTVSATRSAKTLSGLYFGKDGSFIAPEWTYGAGGSFVPVEWYVGKDGTFVPLG